MTAAVKHLVEEPLRRAPEERDELVETLLSHSEPDQEWTDAWVAECERRMEDVRSGKSKLIPGDEVFKMIDELVANEP